MSRHRRGVIPEWTVIHVRSGRTRRLSDDEILALYGGTLPVHPPRKVPSLGRPATDEEWIGRMNADYSAILDE